MLPTDRFEPQKLQNHCYLQLNCPVYVHCTRQSLEKSSGRNFAQLRLVNCAETPMETVVFDLEGLDACGSTRFTLKGLVMSDCNAQPRQIFGEDKIFALGAQQAERLKIRVRRVVFADGMLWRDRGEQEMTTPADAGWLVCECGMPNAPGEKTCRLCGKELPWPQWVSCPNCKTPNASERETCHMCGAELQQTQEELKEFPYAQNLSESYRPAPILRYPAQEVSHPVAEEDEEEEEGVPAWLSILLCVFGTLAVLTVLGFVVFYLKTR